ncbi:MAG: hypothetical protein JRI68_21760, partial [Deltaproteobacteria bacterium]|nr:hypothetical protein [Deltaproteobacteria bacterium]
AIEEGDTETLREDILEAFPEEQIETLEQLLGGADFLDLIAEILEEWSGDDVDELLELLETKLGDNGVDLKPHAVDEEEYNDNDDDDVMGDDYDEYDEPGIDEDV